MRRSYKFRLHPTAKQHVSLEKCLYLHCELYNAALAERRQAYETIVKKSPLYYSQERPKAPVSYNTQSAQLRDIRKLRPDIAIWSFSSQQATLRRLNKAFEGFFRRLRAGESPGYPRFKSLSRFDSIEWPVHGDGCKFRQDGSRVYLQGIGEVKVTLHRKVQGRVKTVSVKREGRRWYLILSCDGVPIKPLAETGDQVGIDVGIVSFITTSDSEHIENPRWQRTGAERLAKSQQVLSAKKRCDCGHIAKENRVSQALFRCQRCGYSANADEHAAKTILRAGLALLAAQAA